MDQPRFQWSKFSPDGRSEQVVVRGDDEVQWAEDIKKAKAMLPQVAFPNDEGPIATKPEVSQAKAPICPEHKKPMRKGKFPGSWYCPTNINPDKNGTPEWCKAKPVLTEWV